MINKPIKLVIYLPYSSAQALLYQLRRQLERKDNNADPNEELLQFKRFKREQEENKR